MTLTVTNAGARIVNISSLMAHPGKVKHLNLRLATLELKYIYKVLLVTNYDILPSSSHFSIHALIECVELSDIEFLSFLSI